MRESSKALRLLAEPYGPADRVKCAIWRAAKLADLSYWRCSDLWYLKAHRILPDEKQRILDALAEKQQAEERYELAKLRTRLATLESRAKKHDQSLDSETLDLFSWTPR